MSAAPHKVSKMSTINESQSTTPPPPPPAAPFPSALPPAPPVAYAATPARFVYRKNPGVAGVLSLLPGGGHLYLGLYQRAGIFFGIWVALWAFVSGAHDVGPFWLTIPFWWIFVLIDAVRQASAINQTGAPESNIVTNELPKASGSLFFGVLLILFGAFFLVDRFVTIDLSFLWDWWPLLLVAFGAWQVFSYYKEKQAKSAASADTTTSSI